MQEPTKVKELMRKEWGGAAPAWRKYDAMLQKTGAPVAELMLEAAQLAPGKRVLDVACGTGEPAIPAAERVAPGGSVLATDLAEEMLEVARDRAKAHSTGNIEFRLADGEELPVEDATFDAVTCRWGIMFMPRPEQFAAEAYRVLKPGGRVVVAVWGPPQDNLSISLPMRVISKYAEVPGPPPGAPGVFAFADPNRLTEVLSGAGFSNVHLEDVRVVFSEFDSGRDYWNYIRDFSGPVRRQLQPLSDDLQAQIAEEVSAEAAGGNPDGPVRLTGLAMVGWGTK